MRLRALLDGGVTVRGEGALDLEIAGLSPDSRTIGPGMLFAAVPGARADGRRFIADAVARGAAAVLADPSAATPDLGVPVIVDPEPRRRLALMAARFYGRQPASVVAVTGTNGKTSTVSFTRQLWSRLGIRAASLGTLGLEAEGQGTETGLTTPDPVRLHALLAELAQQGTQHLALEASSHGLDQHRLDGVRFRAAAFTNLSRDHFDYHGSVAAYYAAKRRLFAELLPEGATAVLNADAPEFDDLVALCHDRGIAVLDYGRRAARIRLQAQEPGCRGQTLALDVDGRSTRVESPLVGEFQAMNLLAGLGLVLATGAAPDAALAGLGAVEGARGRLQLAAVHPKGAPVFVDYAHTPDALEKVLVAVRPHTGGRLWVVFGCGGDRDRGKRPEMGRVAAERADRVVVTDDNPRTEEPASIRRAILAACPGAVEVGDRRAAIRTALDRLEAGDLLVIAGKGHETGQIVGRDVLPFDDAVEVRLALGAPAEAGR